MSSAQAQLRVSPLAPSAVPATLKRSGRVVQALRYTDRTGTYTVLATEIGPRPDSDPATPGSEGQRADLYAYQYPATGPAPSWQVHDFVDDCPLDLEARFLPKALTVTDLDQDGTAEVWLVYRTTCRGDVSPSTQKIILYEGPRKYAVRGTSRIALGGGLHDGGTYTLDAAWVAAPATFRQHAAQLWQQHRDEQLSE
ncbi:MAG: M949_RS01915 family surface polysaccharide biosynthesis protein [Janthinobacterium lividum]